MIPGTLGTLWDVKNCLKPAWILGSLFFTSCPHEKVTHKRGGWVSIYIGGEFFDGDGDATKGNPAR